MYCPRHFLGTLLLINLMSFHSLSHATNYDTANNESAYNKFQVSRQCVLDCPGTWLVGANIGMSWLNTPDNFKVNNNSGFPAPNNVDTYSLKTINNQGFFSLLGGYRWHTNNYRWLPFYALMLQYRHLTTADIKGRITEFSLPGFTNYNYQADLSADSVSLVAKANLYRVDVFSPYVLASVGYARNQVKNYNESARGGITARVNPNYQKNSQNEIIYSLGIGMDVRFSQEWTMAIAFEHQNLGHFQSANGAGINWTNRRINLGSLDSNNALVQILYHFPTV